jgi:hypothetical protein
MRRILFIFTLVIIASAALAAAEFWEAKPFLQWSDREVEKVLTDSPWTALVAIPLPNRGPVPSADAGGGVVAVVVKVVADAVVAILVRPRSAFD